MIHSVPYLPYEVLPKVSTRTSKLSYVGSSRFVSLRKEGRTLHSTISQVITSPASWLLLRPDLVGQ